MSRFDWYCIFGPDTRHKQVKVLLISAAAESGELAAPLPTGLACVAAATERAAHNVRLLSLGASGEREFQIADAVLQFRPGVIGISARNIDDQNMQAPHLLLASLRELVAACRRDSDAPIVLGGAGYSIFPQPALTYLQADIGIKGEGEMAFPALLRWIEQGKQGVPPPGTYLRNGTYTTTAFVPTRCLPATGTWLLAALFRRGSAANPGPEQAWLFARLHLLFNEHDRG
jgi:hypothetical protein